MSHKKPAASPSPAPAVRALRTGDAYARMIAAPAAKRADIYRHELMAPFKAKWDCYRVPLRPAQPGGYDVVMASEMLGILPPAHVDESWADAAHRLADDDLWHASQQAVERALARFVERDIQLPVQDYLFSILLGNPDNPALAASDGYCGDGGIPGYVLAWLVPSDDTVRRLPAALAHETNHNVRFQFIAWRDDITLGEMMVSEGLAENFAVSLYGEENAGPWVTKTSADVLESTVKPAIRTALDVQGMAGLSAYLYGDEIAAAQGYPTVGLPYCAGYACGYDLVRCYLNATGTDIAEATLLPAEVILQEAEAAGFWG
ncbi:DUF2268 domain-containing protein [Eggerthella lenta]|uniref:DUF2268 domain-containing protein n=1 Tax=Eggerthella lenta TaxID=84112 RepID=UPI000E44D05B|nr:DUF2268 domain-containing protein [Eggerthella lenta]RGL79542.1 Zn-dependent protease [Eggerthella lenta]